MVYNQIVKMHGFFPLTLLKGMTFMRKLLNKKGFSLQELLVVVFLMGLLLAISVPAYDGLHKRSENKACATNIEMIKLAVVEYYNSNQEPPSSVSDLAPFLDEGIMPICSKSVENRVEYHYGLAVVKNADGTYSGQVQCACTDSGHDPEGAVDSLPTNNGLLRVEAKTITING